MGMILSSTVEKTRVFRNPIDLSACSSGGYAHKNRLHITKHHRFVTQYGFFQFSMKDYFYNLGNIFVNSSNYTGKINRNVERID